MLQAANSKITTTILFDFFNRCIGTGDERQLVDVIVTDSSIKQVQAGQRQTEDGRIEPMQKTVDRIPAYDINYVMSNEKYHTYRIPASKWEKVISLLKKMAYVQDQLGYEFAKGEEDPREQLFLEKLPNNQFYAQQMVMQDLGLDWPVSVLLAEMQFKGSETFTNGDIEALETRFHKAGQMLNDAFHLVKRNLMVLHADKEIKRDHLLHYSNFIDFENHKVYASLSRFGWKLSGDNDADFGIVPAKLDPKDWEATFTSEASRTALMRLDTVFNGFNTYIDQHFQMSDADHELRTFTIKRLFAGAWNRVMKSSEMVYGMDLHALDAEVDVANEELMKEVIELDGKPGLDLNSWKAYDYTNADEPTLLKDFSPSLHEKYRQEFVQLMYTKLLTSGHSLLRPFSTKRVITDPAEIAEHKVGEVRTERF